MLQTTASIAGPSTSQVLPPYLGSGLLHIRVLFLIPVLHDLEHGSYSDQLLYPPCIGQRLRKHSTTSESGPKREQFCPPNCGTGWLHFLVLNFLPLLHVLSHGENSVQAL